MRGFRPSLVAGAIALALCTGTASAQFSGTYIFGDSLERRRPVRRALHHEPGPHRADVRRPELGLRVDAVVHRRQRLRAGRRARESPPPDLIPPGVPNISIAQQVIAVHRQGPAGSQRALPDPGRRQRHSRAGRRSIWPGRSRWRRCRRGSAQAALDLAAQVGKLQAAGAQYIVLQNLSGRRQDARTPSRWASRPTVSAIAGLVQFDAQCCNRRRRPAGHPVQHVQVRRTRSSPTPRRTVSST